MIRAELAWGLFELPQTAVPLRGLGGMATWFGIRLVMPPRAISGQSVGKSVGKSVGNQWRARFQDLVFSAQSCLDGTHEHHSTPHPHRNRKW
jgi:hypothetical protein